LWVSLRSIFSGHQPLGEGKASEGGVKGQKGGQKNVTREKKAARKSYSSHPLFSQSFPPSHKSNHPLFRSRSPVHRQRKSPVTRDASVPIQHKSSVTRTVSLPVQHKTSGPIQHKISVPVQTKTSVPIQNKTSVPVQHKTSLPVQHRSSLPFQHKTPVNKTFSVPLQQYKFTSHRTLHRQTPLCLTNPAERGKPRLSRTRGVIGSPSQQRNFIFDDQVSLVSSVSSEEHIYEEIADLYEKEENLSEKEYNSFLLSISTERRNNLKFYGCAGWDFEGVPNSY